MRNDNAESAGNAVLTTSEVRAAIDALSSADHVRLLKAAQFFSDINGLDDAAGLLQEGIVRALVGSRLCPRDIPIVPFLFGVIKSIANSAAKAMARSPINRFAEIDEVEDEEQSEGGEVAWKVTPERIVAAQEMLQNVNDMFKDDAEVQLVLYAMAEGLQGMELREALGLTETQHNSIRRRMVRKSEPLADAWRSQ